MNSHQRARPTRNASAANGTVSVKSQTDTSRTCESAHRRRPARIPPNAATRKHATQSTGARARRARWDASWRRCASRTATAANSTTVRISRSGRTRSSTKAGSEPVTMNAFAGQLATQLVQGTGTG